MSPELQDLLDFCRQAVQVANKARQNLEVHRKPDGSLVTNADHAVEKFLRETLPSHWPETAVWGEEFGYETPRKNGLWLIDPIDGTTNFSFGGPLWGLSIALMDTMGIRLGAVLLPDLGIELLAERGAGAYWNQERLPVLPAGMIEDFELVSINDRVAKKDWDLHGKPRMCGAFVIDGAFTVKQWFRAMYAQNERLYDVAGVVLAARETGMNVCYLDGSPFVESELLEERSISKPWKISPRSL